METQDWSRLAADWADAFDEFRSAAAAHADDLRRGERPPVADLENLVRLRAKMTAAEEAYLEVSAET